MSSIKLKHASGNSMSIAAPATNPSGALELKLPATIGSANQYLKNSSTAGTLEFGSLTTTHGATNFTIADGNLVVAAGHGIDFSAQTATSATGATTGDELLDHYEEGTFTPVAAQGTFTVNKATYTRIGRSVTYQIYGQFSSNSSGSPQSLTNFPFAQLSGSYHSAAVNSNTGSSSHPVAQLDASDGHMYFKDTSNNAFNGGDMSGHFVILSGVFHTT